MFDVAQLQKKQRKIRGSDGEKKEEKKEGRKTREKIDSLVDQRSGARVVKEREKEGAKKFGRKASRTWFVRRSVVCKASEPYGEDCCYDRDQAKFQLITTIRYGPCWAEILANSASSHALQLRRTLRTSNALRTLKRVGPGARTGAFVR